MGRKTRPCATSWGWTPHVRLLNAFGSTECSDDVTHYEVTGREEPSRIPIGMPVANVCLYVLSRNEADGAWHPVEQGEAGELFVGGVAVAQGYVDGTGGGQPSFFQDPVDRDSPTGRLYRTGDVVRFDHGVLHYLGRADRLTVIAGVRLEPAGVETVSGGHPAVMMSAVVAVRSGGRSRLAAFYTTSHAVTVAELRDLLEANLPKVTVPDLLTELASLPVSGNGKIGYRALERHAAAEEHGVR